MDNIIINVVIKNVINFIVKIKKEINNILIKIIQNVIQINIKYKQWLKMVIQEKEYNNLYVQYVLMKIV